jgi:small subunit ribosomal protein S2
MPYVTHRWLGGMLTNFSTMRKSVSRMEDIERMKNDGTFDELTKKESLMLEREQNKLEQTLGGIANMSRLPEAIFLVDTIKEEIALKEAVKLNIPIIAMVDTNSDPDVPDYIIPSNDDSARTIQLITTKIADAIIQGTAEREAQSEEEMVQQAGDQQQSGTKQTTPSDVKGKRRKRKRKKKKKKKKGSKDSSQAKAKKSDSSDEETSSDEKKEKQEAEEQSSSESDKKKQKQKDDDQESPESDEQEETKAEDKQEEKTSDKES